jgi:hypothetical protein
MGEGFPTTREEAYARLEASRSELLDAIAGLTPDQMAERVVDDWSVKDLLTHITSWEEQVVPDLRRLARGHVPALMAFQPDRTDDWNCMIMMLRRNFPLEQVLEELERTRLELKAGLDALKDQHFAAGYVPVTISITAAHDADHTSHIREWRSARGI